MGTPKLTRWTLSPTTHIRVEMDLAVPRVPLTCSLATRMSPQRTQRPSPPLLLRDQSPLPSMVLLLLSNSTSVVLSSTSAEPPSITVSSSLVWEPRMIPTTGSSRTLGALPGVRRATSESRETCPRRAKVSAVSNPSHPNQSSENLAPWTNKPDKGSVCKFLNSLDQINI